MGAIFADTIAFIIASIVSAVKSTLFWGGDALICGLGNWLANAVTGILGAAGFGAGGAGIMVGGSGWIPAILGAISGVGGTIIHAIWNLITTILPAIGVVISAIIAFLLGPI